MNGKCNKAAAGENRMARDFKILCYSTIYITHEIRLEYGNDVCFLMCRHEL
jgi:hypothetical protein